MHVTRNNISSFLGFTSYYWKFIKFFSRKVVVLQAEKNLHEPKFCWSEQCDHELKQLIEEFANTLIWAFLDFSKVFYLETDVSRDRLGACLSQSYPCLTNVKHSYLHLVQFASHTMNNAEKNYSVTELRALAVCYALHKWHYLLCSHCVTLVH